MQKKSYYEILGVSPQASFRDIKKAYRTLAKQYHPDKNRDATPESKERFLEIAEAWRVLSNLKKRKAYDESMGRQTPPGRPYPFSRPHYSGYPYHQFDFVTPFIHSFFVPGVHAPNPSKAYQRVLFLNWRILLVSVFGALIFFKFFSAFSGTVTEKTVDSDFFNSTQNILVIKNENGDTREKRVRPALYDEIKVGDHIQKQRFSFVYRINDVDTRQVTVLRFFFQVALIHIAISGFLLFLEVSRR